MPKLTPQHHQQEAVDQLEGSKSLIANHGLGSGKTFTSILAGEKTPGPKLVLAPAALLGNYRKELKKTGVPEGDYHLLSYEKFRKSPDAHIDRIKPSLLIADEFHRTKDSGTATGDSIRQARLRVPKFLGLTGTMAQNHPSEIAELVHNATGAAVLGRNKQEFAQNFIQERTVKPGLLGRLMGRKPGIVEEPKNLDKFKAITQKYVHTFAGDEEYKKHIPTVDREVVRVPMDKNQQRVYDFTFGEAPAWVRWKIKNNLPPGKREALNMNAFLIGARQASTALEPFGNPHETPKMNAVLDDIQKGVKSNPHFKGVVYSSFLGAGLKPLEERLKKAKIPYGSFTGEQPSAVRNQMVADYNTGKLKTLLISPAGGEGLDLKGTNYMALLDPSWNPAKINQAVGRVARFKSHEHLPEDQRRVKVRQFLSEPQAGLMGKIKKFFNPNAHAIGVDEYIYNRAKEKESLNNQFVDVLAKK